MTIVDYHFANGARRDGVNVNAWLCLNIRSDPKESLFLDELDGYASASTWKSEKEIVITQGGFILVCCIS